MVKTVRFSIAATLALLDEEAALELRFDDDKEGNPVPTRPTKLLLDGMAHLAGHEEYSYYICPATEGDRKELIKQGYATSEEADRIACLVFIEDKRLAMLTGQPMPQLYADMLRAGMLPPFGNK